MVRVGKATYSFFIFNFILSEELSNNQRGSDDLLFPESL